MFLFLITLGLICVYFALYFILPRLFRVLPPHGHVSRETFVRKSLPSLLIITSLSFIGYIVAFSISNEEIGNRVLHGFGGGFMALLTCFLSVRDMKLKIDTFQFSLVSFMIVMCLGIGNEILELILHNTTSLVFTRSINDTWLDLVSNLIGCLIALSLFAPFLTKKASVSREKREDAL